MPPGLPEGYGVSLSKPKSIRIRKLLFVSVLSTCQVGMLPLGHGVHVRSSNQCVFMKTLRIVQIKIYSFLNPTVDTKVY